LDKYELVQFENAPMDVHRTVGSIERFPTDFALICQQLSGRLQIEQSSRTASVEAGDFFFLDGRQPYVAKFTTESRMLVMKVPRAVLAAHLGCVEDIAGVVVKPDNAFRRLTSGFLSMLPEHSSGLEGAEAATVAAYALELSAISAMGLNTRQSNRSFARAAAAARLMAGIEARLADPDLDPASVAAAAGVSLRRAQMLMAAEGMTIVRYMQNRRLEECRKALISTASAKSSIGEIAFAWVFSDFSHFSRVFRKRYGVTPSAYRHNRGSAGADLPE
jgi:AraC-like DNA-binding protein